VPASFIKVAIPTSYSLQEVESAIAGEEALNTRFVSNSVTTEDGEIVNEAKFERLSTLPLPDPPTLKLASDAAPSGKKHEWSGGILIKGSIKQVALYR